MDIYKYIHEYISIEKSSIFLYQEFHKFENRCSKTFEMCKYHYRFLQLTKKCLSPF